MSGRAKYAGQAEPAPGQVWSIVGFGFGLSGRMEFRVTDIKPGPGGVAQVHGVSLKSGRPIAPIALKTLRRAMRGARLLQHPDGTPFDTSTTGESSTPEVEKPRATRVYQPRGVPKRATLSDLDRQVLQMLSGSPPMSRDAIAKQLGISPSTVETVKRRVEEIRAFERMRASG